MARAFFLHTQSHLQPQPLFQRNSNRFRDLFFLLVQQLPVKEPRCGMILQTSGKAEVEATLRVPWEAQARRRATTFEKRLGCAPSESSEVIAPKPELSKCTKNLLWNIKQLKWQGIWNESVEKQVTNTNKPSFRNASFICDSLSITAHRWLRSWYHMSYSCFRNPTSATEMKPEQCRTLSAPKVQISRDGCVEVNSHAVVIHRVKALTLTHPLDPIGPLPTDFSWYRVGYCLFVVDSQSHGAGCASQDPEASVGGPFAILSDLGPSKGTEGLMVWIFPEWVYFLPTLLCCQRANDKPWNFENTGKLGAVRVTKP